jgi:hypothetical protein
VRGELTTCSHCGVGNDHDGSFCYLCGHSLLTFAPADGPWLFPEGSIARTETRRPATSGLLAVATPVEKRIRQKNPSRSGAAQGRSGWRYGFVAFFQFAVLGLVAALLVEVYRLPDHLPPGSDPSEKGTEVVQAIVQARASRGADLMELTETQVNNYLAERAQPRGFLRNLARFEAVRLQFMPGLCRVWTTYSVLGRRIYFMGVYRAGEDCGRPIFRNQGGAIGRLPLAPWAMGLIQASLFGKVWDGLTEERETINRFRIVEFGPQKVTFLPLP